ncbi:MAG: hypothetical protein E7043_02490 [Lentisphaerae bacterium]|nr:hypothetical protein [Lentisphaerota bacterium]
MSEILTETSLRPAYYSLRRTLPEWKFDDGLRELADAVCEYEIDEVIVKLDTEEFSHGHPSLEWAKRYQEKLFLVKEALESRGVKYSLNPWITSGHADRGRDDRCRMPGFQFMVGADGSESRHSACFISPAWREYLQKLWGIYAATGPHIMWVEDDIRTFNHEPVEFGCFCPLHMAMFQKRTGTAVSREELVRAILHPGEVDPLRREYLAMQREIMVDTAHFLARCVHDISPGTSLGLMSSGPRMHALEGRDWSALAEALADGGILYSRPPMGNYFEDSMRGFYYSQDSIKLTRSVLPPGTVEQTECENIPFTRFSKSVNFTFLELAISFAYGSAGVTLNIFDHCGTPMQNEVHYLTMLRDKKPFFSALTEVIGSPDGYRGVQLIHRDGAAFCKRLESGCAYRDLEEDGFEMMQALESHGIATSYEKSSVSALSGETAGALTDEEILELLHGGILLDAMAAKILFERGFGELIGIRQIRFPESRREFGKIVSAEEFHSVLFGGRDGCYLTATLPFLNSTARFSSFETLPGAIEISSWVDPDTCRFAPAMSGFVNSLGGRVVVHSLEYKSCFGPSFASPFRREQLHGVINWLAGGTAPLLFDCDGAFALAFRKECSGHTVIGAFNLNLDDWFESRFSMSWDNGMPRISVLGADGKWLPEPALNAGIDGKKLTVTMQKKVDFKFPLILRLEYKS